MLLFNLTKYFDLFDAETTPDYRLLDSFFDHIFFHFCNHSSFNNCIAYLESLDYFCHEVVSSSLTLVIVTSASAISFRNM